jgi:ATP-dependent helicase/nuclease subunit A
LAEPNLFLGKYARFTHEGEQTGLKIDLNRNFRSRSEVLDGTNFLFKQLMGMTVGEIEYDEDASLKKGASYPEDGPHPIEMFMIDGGKNEEEAMTSLKEESEGEGEAGFENEELENAQLEARMMAKLIKKAIGEKKQIIDPKTGESRSTAYRDIVILLRSMPWAPQIIEEFKKAGIPVYANLSTGYFEATEVAIMLSLLKIIDNPQQDIPLASVLRSPIAGLDEEELAQVRLFHSGSYYQAMAEYCLKGDPTENEALYEKVSSFYKKLTVWRKAARQEALSDLIWLLFRDTGFYDFAGGMPGGKQRQANLRALYDRARQYESSSFRGLFRFLRFIERMQERGDDLGAARALGEQEDVVRIMTIHSSKGLEFPIVMFAGLSRQFNMMDIRKSYLLDKDLGFASKFVNPELRITYPSLPQIAFKKKKQLEMIAEEMRVLYVALTRAKEKLYLICSLKDAQKSIVSWSANASHGEWLLKDYVRANAKSYMDWIGPAIIRHQDLAEIAGMDGGTADDTNSSITGHPSKWKARIVALEELQSEEDGEAAVQQNLLDHVKHGENVEVQSGYNDQIHTQLTWIYPHLEASIHRSKQSVSELKRQNELRDQESSTELLRKYKRPISRRPQFLQEKSLTPAEKGTITHLVMQHIDVRKPVTEAAIDELLHSLIDRELLKEEQMDAVDKSVIANFFNSKIGERLSRAEVIRREVPFTMSLQAAEIYSDWKGADEQILVQGVIDCIFEDHDGLVLIDYKTDAIQNRFANGFQGAKEILADRYRLQLELYTRAIEEILNKKVMEKYLFFFDGAHLLEM